MAGNCLQRLETHAPSKAQPSATLRSAPVWTFDGMVTKRLDTAFTAGQLSAPPPKAVTLQADQRTYNKVIVSSAFTLPYLQERTSSAVMSFLAITPANFLNIKDKLLFIKFLLVINFFSFGGGR